MAKSRKNRAVTTTRMSARMRARKIAESMTIMMAVEVEVEVEVAVAVVAVVVVMRDVVVSNLCYEAEMSNKLIGW